MKKRLFQACVVMLSTTLFYACNPEEEVMTDLNNLEKANKVIQLSGCEKITFDNFTRGQNNFVTEVTSDQNSGPILISAFQRTRDLTYSTSNLANIFDSNRKMIGNQVDDILTPNEDFGGGGIGDGGKIGSLYANNSPLGNLLIINRGNDYNLAYDYNDGGKMTFDFSALGTVTLMSVTVVDIDSYEAGSKVILYGQNSSILKEVTMEVSGNNGKQIVNLDNTRGVARMEVIFGPADRTTGSAAIDNIEFCREIEEPSGCTLTQGYWKTHGEIGSRKFDANWGDLPNMPFYGSGKSYLELMHVDSRSGNAYVILAHQYIAAMLNMKKASSPTEVDVAMAQARAYFSANLNGNFQNTISTPYTTVQREYLIRWAALLADYNEGKTGPGHCD